MKILVTGAAGFIGAAVMRRLAETEHTVMGIDNFNKYYDTALKLERLKSLGFKVSEEGSVFPLSDRYCNIFFKRESVTDGASIKRFFKLFHCDAIIHLAAQAGVSYSLSHPHDTVKNNISGFLNILEGCRESEKIPHILFASSSSVYGLNSSVPFCEDDDTSHPVSIYGVSKKTDELLAHTYSHLYGFKTTVMRFFTVYGPMGRPDMAPWLFMDAVFNNKPIHIFNNGDMMRDFTYIDDVAESVVRLCEKLENEPAGFRIFNVGHGSPVGINEFVSCIEAAAGRSTIHIMEPMRDGDVKTTFADCSKLQTTTGYLPDTPLEKGIKKTVEWFRKYHGY